MTLTVVTPWYQSHHLADRYFRAIDHSSAERVLIIDNGSDPPLYAQFREWYGGRVFDVRLDRNLGFSRACNAGLAVAQRMTAPTDAVLFLNNDIAPAGDGDWLKPIRDELRPGVLVGAHLRFDPHTAVDGRVIPYLDGWCLAGMAADLLALAGWDEGFEEPSYFGDNDLCFRARRAGMRLVEAPVTLRHLGNQTSRRMDVRGVTERNYERFADKVRAASCAAA